MFPAFITQSQVILPTPETAFEPSHHFNPSVIKARQIRKIIFEIIDKKDFEVAVDKSLVETYEFNADGNLSRHYYTYVSRVVERQVTRSTKKGKKIRNISYTVNDFHYDTISTKYFYQDGKLVLRRYHNGSSYYEGRYYRYDADGNLTKELRYKETNNSPNAAYFVLGNQLLLSVDSFQYKKQGPNQVKCVLLNSEFRPYKEKIISYDSAGRKKSVHETYTAASWIRQEENFSYEKGKLKEAVFRGNASNDLVLKHTYEYDALNELYTEKQFRNGELVKEISYVTGKDTLLNSMVQRDPVNKTMRIIKLKYEMEQVGKAR